jgi:hypothetical protein
VTTRLRAALAALLLLAATIAATIAGTAPAATADTETACDEQLAVLRADVGSVAVTGGKADKERAGLVKLADDAAALVTVGKTADALAKLANLQTKVDQLAAAERISAESAARLSSDIGAATGCLSAV